MKNIYTVDIFTTKFNYRFEAEKVLIKTVEVEADNATLAEMLTIADNGDLNWTSVKAR